jgi:hypothetical protein
MSEQFATEAGVFAEAWEQFCPDVAAAVMPEATFQAWFAHRLIGPFPMRRVVRERDFDPQRSTSPHHVGFRTSVHLDIAITRHAGVTLPRRAAAARGPGGWDSLRDLTIISELKVASSTIGGLTYGMIAQDYRKL